MKKTMASLLVLALVFSLAACSSDNGKEPTPTVEPSVETTPTEAPAEPTQIPDPEVTQGESNGNSEAADTLSNIHQAVKDAFGEDYVPSAEYDAVALEEKFGLTPDMYDAIVAEGPMISTQVDEFIAVHVTEGNLELVQQALKTYQDGLKADQMQYPMNQMKIQGSVVETIGDYVFFCMLGFVENEDQDDDALAKAYTELNQKAIDAAKGVLEQ